MPYMHRITKSNLIRSTIMNTLVKTVSHPGHEPC